ncbi:hypothetical protein [Arthrobacter methylotrophus]|uniref:hypothetical protein n=1 Tax=Arthrobacter methylotrophus TaxID=121291 RepID=UPI0031EB9F69
MVRRQAEDVDVQPGVLQLPHLPCRFGWSRRWGGLAAALTQHEVNLFVARVRGKIFEVVTGRPEGEPARRCEPEEADGPSPETSP